MFQLEKNKTKVVNTSASLAGLAVVDMGLSPMKLPDKFLAKIRRLTFSSLGSGGKGAFLVTCPTDRAQCTPTMVTMSRSYAVITLHNNVPTVS